MEAATVPAEQNGQPVEQGAEATRTVAHLFQWAAYVHVGEGAAECVHATDGKCQDREHFHAWLCVPNALQQNDVLEKARAAKARRKLAMRDPQTDAYAILESELDDLMNGPREPLVEAIAERELRQKLPDIIEQTQALDEFEDFRQHREEFQRLDALAEEERPPEYEQLKALVAAYEKERDERLDIERQAQRETLSKLPDESFRATLRASRIEGEGDDVWSRTYYTWLEFVGTHKCPGGINSPRMWGSLEDMRGAPAEAILAIDNALTELENRMQRGDVAGN